MREGWKCPSCGKAHGPHIDTCPGGRTKTVYGTGTVEHDDHTAPRLRRPIPVPPDPYVWRDYPNCVDPRMRSWSANFTGAN